MGFHEVQTKANEIHQAVAESSVLVGAKSNVEVAGLTVSPGLGMHTYSKRLEEEAERLRNSSMFKILFMGTFKNGKSTTVNALLGGNLLPTGATATTAVISQVVYGEDTNTVKIYREGKDGPEKLALDAFADQYSLSDEDIQMIEDEGSTDRFKDIDYVVLESNLGIFKDGVQFIDSPGLGEAVARTKTTNRFIPQANAIVFLLDALKLFSHEEKTFIRKHFVNVDPKPRNVFFLVNRVNQLNGPEAVDSVKRQTQIMLKSVFTGDNGFDAELYNNRVFFVNSHGALQMQMAGRTPVGTGIPEFKMALEQFLTSEDRVIAKYKPVVSNMASIYLAAEKQVREDAELLKKDIGELEKNQAAAKEQLQDLQNEIVGIEKLFDLTKKNITNKVLNSLETFVQIDLISDWPVYAEKFDDRFGMTDMLKLAMPVGVSEERKQEILAPMVRYVNEYVEKKLEAWADGIPLLIDNDIKILQDELKDRSISFDLKLDQARAIFAGTDASGWQGAGASKLQLALSLIQGDVSIAVENSAGGNFSWGEFFKQYLIQGMLNLLLMNLFGGGPLGLIAWVVLELVQMRFRAHSARDNLLNGFAEKLFPKIGENLLESAPTISADVALQFDRQKGAVTSSAYGLINDETERQNSIIAQAKSAKEDKIAERNRQDQVLEALYKRTNLIYNLLFNKDLALTELEKVAAMTGVSDSN